MTAELLYHKVESKLISDNCSTSTIKLYLAGIKRFVKFSSKEDVTKIDEGDLAEFSKSLFKSKRLKHGTIRPIKFGINYAFNNVLDKGFDMDLIPTPKPKNVKKEFFTKKEIAKFFSTIRNIKYKAIFQFMYATGMDLAEIKNLKISDIDSNKKKVSVRNNHSEIVRQAYLPASILDILRWHFRHSKPTVFLFEGEKKGVQISDRNIQHAFKVNLKLSNINKDLTTRSLKHSYVKHLTEDGIPLNSILEHLQISNSESLRLYSDICFPIKKYNISPLDTILIEQADFEFFDTSDLEYILGKVTDTDEHDYLQEGIKCFKANALRAGVIFLWTAAVWKIQKMCMTESIGYINIELKKIYPKAKDVKVIEDFEYVKDEYLLELACRLKKIDKTTKEELKNTCLDLRNKCGHPGSYKPKFQKIKAFVEDIIGMLY